MRIRTESAKWTKLINSAPDESIPAHFHNGMCSTARKSPNQLHIDATLINARNERMILGVPISIATFSAEWKPARVYTGTRYAKKIPAAPTKL